MKYGTNTNFYVFYDKNDFVECFGTAEQLVKDGYFPTRNSVSVRVSKIRAGRINRKVVVLPLLDKKG